MDENKKVLFVATVVKMHINVFHLPYLQWFGERGYETHVAARNDFDGEECIIPNCDIHHDIHFERSPINFKNLKAYKKLKNIIEENEYKIIHCHTPVAAILTRLAAIKARKKGTKVIYTAHGFHFFKDAPILNWILYYPAEKICSYLTDALITINKEDYSLAKNKMSAKNVYYIPGVGVDTNKFSHIVVDKNEKRIEIDVPTDAIMILSIGELNKNKNHEIIIKALAKLNNSNIYYCIAGKGKLNEYLDGLAESLNITKQVNLLGFRSDITELCKSSDIFCFPSYREGLSLSLMEAMSVGLPVICSNIRGNVDLIQSGKGGYLCNPTSIDEFVIEINKLIIDKELKKQMGEYNREFVKEFDIESAKEKIVKIYEEFLK